jgi:multimeric flavodoxin WrbA
MARDPRQTPRRAGPDHRDADLDGTPSSVCKMILERLDAELSETDEQGSPQTYGKVAAVAVVGNEDGAHHVTAEVFQALNDVGVTIPVAASTYWVGKAMTTLNYDQAGPTPNTTGKATKTLAANAAQAANLLNDRPYPAA